MSILRAIIALACLCLPFTTHAETRAEIPLEDFFRHEKFTSAKISPKGGFLAATVPVDDQTRLAIVDIEEMEATTVFRFRPNTHVNEYYWVRDDRVIIRPVRKYGTFDRPLGTGELVAGNADGSNKEALLSGFTGLRVLSLLREDPDHILVLYYSRQRYPEVLKVKVDTGRNIKIMRSPVRMGYTGDLLVDHDGQIRVAVGNDEEGNIIVMYRKDDDSDWRQLGHFDSDTEGAIRPLVFMPDNRRFLAAADIKDPVTGLVLVDPERDSHEVLFRHDSVDISGLMFASDRKTPIGVMYEPDLPRMHILDAEHPDARIYRGLEQAFPNHMISITSVTRDGKLAVLKAYSDRDPGEFFLVNLETFKVSPMVRTRPWIDPARMSEQRPIAFKARDGVVIHGYITLPRGHEPENLPMIVNPHGGPHGPRDRWEFNEEVQFLASRGYAVLQVNFRGSGGYGREFQSMGHRHWGTSMQDDVTDGTRWAVEQGFADPDRICIYGASYGGYAALQGVVREPDLYQCAVGYVGVYDLTLMRWHGDIPEIVEGEAYLDRVLGDDKDDLMSRSPVYNADRIKVPVLLVHGGRDRRVPIEQMERLVGAFKQQGVEYSTLVKPHEGHGFYQEENKFELYREMESFFDRHIGGD